MSQDVNSLIFRNHKEIIIKLSAFLSVLSGHVIRHLTSVQSQEGKKDAEF